MEGIRRSGKLYENRKFLLRMARMSEKGKLYAYTWLNEWLLRFSGFLPPQGEITAKKEAVRYVILGTSFFYFNFLLIPCVEVILNKETTKEDLMTAVILLLSCGGGELKVILVLINRKTIGRLLKAIEELANDTESEEFAILSSWAVIGRRLTLCFVSFGVMLAFHWAFLPVFLHFTGLKIAEMTPYPLSINVSSIDALKFEMICIAQTVSAFGCVFSAVGVDSIRVTLIFEICGQLDLICFWLKQTQSDDLVSSRDIIYKCARRHRFMLICSKKLEESTTYATLVQLLTIMYMIAISGANFFLATSDVHKSVYALILGIIQLIFLCWPGDMLISTSFHVAEALYFVPWYNYPRDVKSLTMVMITRAQKPVVLTAGKFAELSLETFSAIMSRIVSCFMVLKECL